MFNTAEQEWLFLCRRQWIVFEKSPTILAIDDNPDILYTLAAIGETFGWNVIGESSGKLAVEKLSKLQPDIILVDYHMPGQDGISVVQAIRRQDRLVPIIVLTVDERQEIADQFLESGANDFANKPIKVADLAARIKVHLNIRQQLDCFVREKGINNGTLDIVNSCCKNFQRPFFAEEVVDASGLAYQTVVRYLQHLEDQKIITASSHYGKIGRPKKRYQYLTP